MKARGTRPQARLAAFQAGDASEPAKSVVLSALAHRVRAVFDRRRQISRRLADAADLLIDFATLGEYGLEPVAEPAPPQCRPGRGHAMRSPGSPRSAAVTGIRR